MDLKVYLSYLRGGKERSIDLVVPSSFMEVDDSHLKFESPVLIKGKFSEGDELEKYTRVKVRDEDLQFLFSDLRKIYNQSGFLRKMGRKNLPLGSTVCEI